MRRLILRKECWLRLVRVPTQIKHARVLCTGTNCKSGEEMDEAAKRREAYKQLEKLDFVIATEILLTVPPKRKKFGLDFHLVQLFFCCLPSLAVYFVAMYARREMRKMEAEFEVKRKAEEETKAKEFARVAAEEKLRGPEAQILEVKERLEKLESVIEVIADKVKQDNATNKQREQAASTSDAEHNKSPKTADVGDSSSTSQNEVEGTKANKPVLPNPKGVNKKN